MTSRDFLLVVAAYLVGSLPMGLLLGKLRGVDVRQHGSGNIGATNVGRVLGRPWFFVAFVLDFAKSFAPVQIARAMARGDGLDSDQLGLAAGVAAVIGHVFPIWLRFKGGKGVATATGVFAALAWAPTVIGLVAWLVVWWTSRYVSLASLVGAAVLPLACFLLPEFVSSCKIDRSVQWAAVAVAALIIVRHRANIGRLLRGEEPRTRSQAS